MGASGLTRVAPGQIWVQTRRFALDMEGVRCLWLVLRSEYTSHWLCVDLEDGDIATLSLGLECDQIRFYKRMAG